MKWALVLLAVVAITGKAGASDLDSMELASQLGAVLAAEKPCHLTYDMMAIQKYIAATVQENDMRFGSMLQTMVQSNAYQMREMTPATLTALCAQTARVARFNGFIH